MNDIFDLQQSSQDRDFLARNADLELDVLANIIETSKDVPFIGSLIKLAKVGLNIIDLRYVRKLGLFLKQSEDIPEEKKTKLLLSLSHKDKKRISEYLSHLLYTADEDVKAELMGRIYCYRVNDLIDNEQMLRLCSVVNKSFFFDLSHLMDYKELNDSDGYITNNLNALGLLKNCGNFSVDEGVLNLAKTKYQLNEIGTMLMNIMDNAPIEPFNEDRQSTCRLEPIPDSVIENICL